MKTTVLLSYLGLAILLLGWAGRHSSAQNGGTPSAAGFHPLIITYPPSQPFILVLGDVKKPGRVIWTNGLTLTGAISLAGGFTDFASKSQVTLRKASGSPAQYSFSRQAPPWTNSPALDAGDTVQVPNRDVSWLWH